MRKGAEIPIEEETVVVQIDERLITYPKAKTGSLKLAYATTIHKSQGSEYPAVILPIAMQHFVMLQRNLLYTGITRAREMVVLVGGKKALALAVKNADTAARHTHLSHRLRRALPAPEGGA